MAEGREGQHSRYTYFASAYASSGRQDGVRGGSVHWSAPRCPRLSARRRPPPGWSAFGRGAWAGRRRRHTGAGTNAAGLRPSPRLIPVARGSRSPQAPATVYGPDSERAASVLADGAVAAGSFRSGPVLGVACASPSAVSPLPHSCRLPASRHRPCGRRTAWRPSPPGSGRCPPQSTAQNPPGLASRRDPGCRPAASRCPGVPPFPAGRAALSAGARAEAPSRSSPGVPAAPMWVLARCLPAAPRASARHHVRPRLSQV